MIDGNDIWEALFSILKGNVPDEMTVEVCEALAAALSTVAEQGEGEKIASIALALANGETESQSPEFDDALRAEVRSMVECAAKGDSVEAVTAAILATLQPSGEGDNRYGKLHTDGSRSGGQRPSGEGA